MDISYRSQVTVYKLALKKNKEMNEKLKESLQWVEWASAVLPGCAYYEAAEYGRVVWVYLEGC